MYDIAGRGSNLKDVEHATHLAENEYPRNLLLHLRKQLVKNNHLAAVLDEALVGRVQRPRLGTIEEVRVTGHLTKLHDHFHELCFVSFLPSSQSDH